MDLNDAIHIIEVLVSDKHPSFIEAWQTLKAHCTQPTDVQQLKPKILDYVDIFYAVGLPRDDSDSSCNERKGAIKMYKYIAQHFGH